MKRGGNRLPGLWGQPPRCVARLLFLSRCASCLPQDSFGSRVIAAEGTIANSGRARAAMSPDSVIQRIVELSAEAHTKRREAAYDSAAFHSSTGAIVAYGKALELLSKLKKECYPNNN
jgi:hypothetical protein